MNVTGPGANGGRPFRRPPLVWTSCIVSLVVVAVIGVGALRAATRTETPLPVLGRVADFALVDQASEPVRRADLAGEPWIASFVFTRCATVCPRISERLRTIQSLAQHGDGHLRLVTFSVDPEHDAPSVLASYAEAHGADEATWKFLTGSESTIETIARSFAVALDGEPDSSKADYGIMHSGHLVLVDRRGRIRGYYPSSEDGVEARILDDVKRIDVS